jgi:hypothetical protein
MTQDRWAPARPWPARSWPTRPWPAEAEGYTPRTRVYRATLDFRPLRRFGEARRGQPREQWIA